MCVLLRLQAVLLLKGKHLTALHQSQLRSPSLFNSSPCISVGDHIYQHMEHLNTSHTVLCERKHVLQLHRIPVFTDSQQTDCLSCSPQWGSHLFDLEGYFLHKHLLIWKTNGLLRNTGNIQKEMKWSNQRFTDKPRVLMNRFMAIQRPREKPLGLSTSLPPLWLYQSGSPHMWVMTPLGAAY